MQSDNTKRPLKYRKLRIAWSVFWGLACVLLIVLWVRSYWVYDRINAPIGTHGCAFSSIHGLLGVDEQTRAYPVTNWEYSSFPLEVPQETATASQDTPGTNENDMTFTITTFTEIELNRLITARHGCLALLFAVLAAGPWLPGRFSLRTLLLATTLVAVVLGLVVWLGR